MDETGEGSVARAASSAGAALVEEARRAVVEVRSGGRGAGAGGGGGGGGAAGVGRGGVGGGGGRGRRRGPGRGSRLRRRRDLGGRGLRSYQQTRGRLGPPAGRRARDPPRRPRAGGRGRQAVPRAGPRAAAAAG